MRYLFLIYVDERESEQRSESEMKLRMASHAPYIEMLRRNGNYAGGEALGPARSARTLRSADGRPVVTEGPFAESREQFGGFYVVDAKDLDEAIELASQCPALRTTGVVALEIRPIPARFAPSASDAASTRASYGRHLFLVHRDETTDDEREAEALAAWGPYLERLCTSGVLEAAAPLAASGSATTLRLERGKLVLSDGPFAAGPAQAAVYCIVRARDTDEAVRLASECPDAGRHTIEVRSIRSTDSRA